MLVIPGYLGSNKVIEKWAKIAHDNKVMIYTDFADLEKPDDVIEMFFDSNLSGGDVYKSNVCMACNYLVGRGRYAELGETEDLLIPPSAALAGSVYKTVMAQVTAGKKYGSMSEVDGVAFNLKKSEISELEKIGLIPMVKEYGKVMAFSAKTLFNGDNLGLQTYSVGTCVRLGDQGIDGLPQPARFRELEQQGGEGFAWTNQQVPGQYPGSRTPD